MPRRLQKLEEKGPKLAKEILKLRGKGLGFRQIAKEIKAKFGIETNHMSIKRFISKNAEMVQDYLAGNKEIHDMLNERLIDTIDQLRTLNEKMWRFLEELENEEDKSSRRIQVAKEIREQLLAQNQLIGMIRPMSTQAGNVNILDITLNVKNILKKLEEKKYIKILKTPEGAVV